MKKLKNLVLMSLVLGTSAACSLPHASKADAPPSAALKSEGAVRQAPASAPAPAATPAPGAAAATPAAPQPWTYKTKQLKRADIDALLAKPGKLLVLDVRRPDELISKGSFPVYLNIQLKELEKSLAYIPKDRTIVTVSNRAHRAGAAGDLLARKGFKVAGAAGTLDYEDEGGTVVRITPPQPKPAQ